MIEKQRKKSPTGPVCGWRMLALCASLTFALTPGCGPGGAEQAELPVGYKKITLYFGPAEESLSLTDYPVEFLGLGVWRDGALETTANLSNGSADVYFPIDDVEVKATLVSYRTDDPNYVAISQHAQTITITPTTEEVALSFPAYSPARMVNLVGALYLNDGQPAKSTSLSVVDSFSGTVITLPGESHMAKTDDRGVYALRYFYGDGPVRLRLGDEHGGKELILDPTPLEDPTWQALPFMNLYGTDPTSPFAINMALLKGDKGDTGAPGIAGATPGLLQETIAAGNTNCANGGVKISTWSQKSGTSSATYSEAAGSFNLKVSYLCNGAKGTFGVSGGDAKIYEGTLAIGQFVNGSKLYMKADNAYFSLQDGSEPGTFRVSNDSVAFSTNDCSGAAFMNDSFGRVAKTRVNYVTASLGQAPQRVPIRSELVSYFRPESGSYEEQCQPRTAYWQNDNSGHALALGTGFAVPGWYSSSTNPEVLSAAFTTTGDGRTFNEQIASTIQDGRNWVSAQNSNGITVLAQRYTQPPKIYRTSDGKSFSAVSLPPLEGGSYSDIREVIAMGTTFLIREDDRLHKSPDDGLNWRTHEGFSFYDHDYGSGSSSRYQGNRVFEYSNSMESWIDIDLMKRQTPYFPCDRGSTWRVGTSTRCINSDALYEANDNDPFTWSQSHTNWNEINGYTGSSGQRFFASTNGMTVVARSPHLASDLVLTLDGGTTWSKIQTSSFIQSLAISPDGSNMAIRSGNSVYWSPTQGVAWTHFDTLAAAPEVSSNPHFLSNGTLVFSAIGQDGLRALWTWDPAAPDISPTSINWTSALGATDSHLSDIFSCGNGQLCLGTNSGVLKVVSESDLATPLADHHYTSDDFDGHFPNFEQIRDLGSKTLFFATDSNVHVFDGNTWTAFNGSFRSTTYQLDDGRLILPSDSSVRYYEIDAALISITSIGGISAGISELFPQANGTKILARGNDNFYYRSTDSGRTFTRTTLPLDVEAHKGIFWSPNALVTRDGMYISLDLGETWNLTSIPKAEQVLQVLKNGENWLIEVREAPVEGDMGYYYGNRSRAYFSSTGTVFRPIDFPVYQNLHATRSVTLPIGASFPLGVLRFDPM